MFLDSTTRFSLLQQYFQQICNTVNTAHGLNFIAMLVAYIYEYICIYTYIYTVCFFYRCPMHCSCNRFPDECRFSIRWTCHCRWENKRKILYNARRRPDHAETRSMHYHVKYVRTEEHCCMRLKPIRFCIASNERLITEQWIGKSMDGNMGDRLGGTVVALVWRDWRYHENS